MKQLRVHIILLLLLVSGTAFGQDIHFSQFYHVPMNYNPALTGQFDGCYRFIGNYRTQWSSVTVPYRTFGLSADARDAIVETPGVNAGLSIFQDRTGDSRFSTLVVNLAGSYHKYLDPDSIHLVSGGMHLGLTNRTIDYSDLQFDAQYTGSFYDSNAPNGENFARDSRTWANVNIGGYYQFQPTKRKKVGAGMALFNVTGPKQSFFNDPSIKLDRRFVFHADGVIRINDKFDALPALLFQSQGKFKEFLIGGNVRYVLLDQLGLYRAVYLGGWGRVNDAGNVSLGMDYDNWTVGLSYDINLSDLTPASNNRGGFEINVIYLMRCTKVGKIKHIICPNYI